jgi:putative phosphoribosyl transferase
MRYRNREHAGRVLAERLVLYAGRENLIVLGLPRGGVPVAFEVARRLGAPLDVFVVRKLGVPGHEELAMGAIASGGVRVLNEAVVEELGLDEATIARTAAAETAELDRRERALRGERGPVEVSGRTVIVVDDGLATGSTMRAAAVAVGAQRSERIVVAVPVAARQTVEKIGAEVDEIVCVQTPEPFRAVGLWYEDFTPVTEDEIRGLLTRAASEATSLGRR